MKTGDMVKVIDMWSTSHAFTTGILLEIPPITTNTIQTKCKVLLPSGQITWIYYFELEAM